MRIPWVLYAAGVASTLPLLAAALGRPRLTPARRWILVWSGVSVVANVVALLYAWRGRNNLWLAYLVTPVEASLSLWALSHWQRRPVAQLAFRLLVPLLCVTWVGIVLALENTRTFSLVAESFAGLLVLGAAVYTVVSRTSGEGGSLARQDWLWVGMGLALFAGTSIALAPTSHWLVGRHPELVASAYQVRAVAIIVAQLAITRGILCPALRSGGSSSLVSSPSPSSSSASSLR